MRENFKEWIFFFRNFIIEKFPIKFFLLIKIIEKLDIIHFKNLDLIIRCQKNFKKVKVIYL